MVEFHGWATIHESTVEVDSGNLQIILNKIKEQINESIGENVFIKLYPVNGEYHLSTSGHLNRKTSEVNELLNLFRFIATISPGAYGLIYLKDDEDKEGFENSFRVYVLSRGNLEVKVDNFLSPIIPVIEDII
jgi:hypothetical protein